MKEEEIQQVKKIRKTRAAALLPLLLFILYRILCVRPAAPGQSANTIFMISDVAPVFFNV